MAAGNNWERLAEFVRERRVELGMTQEDARSAGGPSTATMRLIEGALQNSYQPATLRDLEKVLQWGRGSVWKILAGGDPVPLADSTTAPRAAPARPARPAHKEIDFSRGERPALQPFIELVLRDAYTLAGILDRLPPGPLPDPWDIPDIPDALDGVTAIPGLALFPDSPRDQQTWDSVTLSMRQKLDLIGWGHRLAAAALERERRTGLTASGDPALSAAGRASRASR